MATLAHLWAMQDADGLGGPTTASDSVGSVTLTMAEGTDSPYLPGNPGPLGTDGSAFVGAAVTALWVDTTDSFRPSGDMSVAMWAQHGSGGDTDFCGLFSDGGNIETAGWQLLANDSAAGAIDLTVWSPTATDAVGGTFPLDSSWHHFAWTRDATTGDLTVYLDGSQVATATSTPGSLTWPSTHFTVGRRYGGFHDYWNGNVAYLAAYEEVIDATEVLRQFNNPGDFDIPPEVGPHTLTLTGGFVSTFSGPPSIDSAELTLTPGEVEVIGNVSFKVAARFTPIQTTDAHEEEPGEVDPFVPAINPLPPEPDEIVVPLPPWIPDPGPYRRS